MEGRGNGNNIHVCVTGATGFVGSSLVKKLLGEGCIVHATVRNLDDSIKISLLKNLPYADTRLRLFEANLYYPDEYEKAIQDCDFVFHVATPFFHQEVHNSQYKDTTEAAIEGVRSIARCCIKAGRVKRLIYTATVVAASPLKEDGFGFKHSMDESCWTPLNLSLPSSNHFLNDYTNSKTLAEKEALRYNDKAINGGLLEVVTLACGLVGGDTLLSYLPSSIAVLISQPLNEKNGYKTLKYLEELMGKVPIVHIEDVCDAHAFCMGKSAISGRFLCARAYISTTEIANHCLQYHPQHRIPQEFLDGLEKRIEWGSNKLEEAGFVYKHDMKKILEDSIECATKLGCFK